MKTQFLAAALLLAVLLTACSEKKKCEPPMIGTILYGATQEQMLHDHKRLEEEWEKCINKACGEPPPLPAVGDKNEQVRQDFRRQHAEWAKCVNARSGAPDEPK